MRSLRRLSAPAILVAACASLALAAGAQAAPGDVTLVSPPNKTGTTENGSDFVPATSGNGAYVAYLHAAPFQVDLTKANAGAALFLRVMASDAAIPVNVPTGERNGNGFEAGSPSLTRSGQLLAFVSEDTDLSAEDKDFDTSAAGTYPVRDVFLFNRTTRKAVLISRGTGIKGATANNDSNLPSVSSDGRYVAFGTEATNLTPKRVYGRTIFGGVYVRDLQKKTTTLVSLANGRRGEPIDGFDPSIAEGGNLVAFAGRVGPKGIRHAGIIVRDIRRGRTKVVSPADGRDCVEPALAAAGRFVAYTCEAKSRNKGIDQIYVTDLARGRTTLVSSATGVNGRPGGGDSSVPSISANGRLVAFESYANDLGPKDGGRVVDVFVKDTKSGRVYLASRADGDGAAGNAPSENPSISSDGRFVSFGSSASNLTPEDSDRESSVFRYQVLP
jgi:Tol biopolymer transport system component